MPQKIAIVDYGMGNLRSVAKAFEALGADAVVSSRAEDFAKAERIVLPGVGAFGEGMKNLARLGLDAMLRDEVISAKKPLLGICLGMQLLAEQSSEMGMHKGLGFMPARVERFNVGALKVPHVGWNDVTPLPGEKMFRGMGQRPVMYFVHSYHYAGCDPKIVAATCDYGGEFVAAVRKGNIFATQFHPEKSQELGLRMLQNFMEL
jgi:glutamine amidotransferase